VRGGALPDSYRIAGLYLVHVLLCKGELFFALRVAIHSPFSGLNDPARRSDRMSPRGVEAASGYIPGAEHVRQSILLASARRTLLR
jgi:hypothetical protein